MQPTPPRARTASAAAPHLPRDAYEWGAFTANAMMATGALVGVALLARSSWRKARRRAEETAHRSGEPIDASWRHRVAATWSWAVSVAAIALTVTLGKQSLMFGVEAVALMLTGPFLALYAVLGATGPARRKVLVPAAIGAFIPMLLTCAAVWEFTNPERPLPPAPTTTEPDRR